MKAFFLLLLLCLALAPVGRGGEEGAFFEVVRARIDTLPVLAASAEAGSPKFTVVRLNAMPIVIGGERYGAVRVTLPAGAPVSLAWFFSDTTNIDEYGLLSHEGHRLETTFTRFIYPSTANADPEQERAGRRASSLPRPWDLFQLHMLGVPARVLKPGGDYIIWFQFSDLRPTDILMAATFVDPAMKLESEDLPPIFGLPALAAP